MPPLRKRRARHEKSDENGEESPAKSLRVQTDDDDESPVTMPRKKGKSKADEDYADGKADMLDAENDASASRTTEDDEEGEENDEAAGNLQDQPSPRAVNKPGKPPEAGIIKEVMVEHFMCHRKLTVKLCRNVNFIHGQNGSGKSAILAAIQICLGAGARRTHRARNLKELVRHESGPHATARVCVKILNEGDDAFERDTYGDTITVERCIPKGSGYSGYKLYDAQNKEQSRSKQDLDRLLDYLNIQVENPVTVLDQEEAKKFLTGKPSDKYSFFAKATELERMDRSYASVIDHINSLCAKKAQMETRLQPAVDQAAKLKREWKKYQQLRDMQEAVLQLELQLVWANYKDFDQDLQQEQEKLKKVYEKRDKRLAELTQIEELSCTQDEEQRRQDRINQLVKEAQEAGNDKRTLESDVKRALAPIRVQERARAELSQRQLEAQRALKDAQTLLEQERQRILNGDAQTEQARRTQELKQAEDELAVVTKEQMEKREQTTLLGRQYEELEPGVDHAKHQCNSFQSQVMAVEAKVRDLERSTGGNTLAMFGQKCVRMFTLIQQESQRGAFKGPVRGPIGAHLKVKAGKESLAGIAELAIGGGVLDRFIVTNDYDRMHFQKLRQKLGCSARECGTFQMHEGSRYQVPPAPEGIETVASCLQIDDDLVFNCLVDNARIDQNALANSKEEGERALLVRDSRGREGIRHSFIKEVYSLPNGDFWRIMNGSRAMISNERRLKQTIGMDQTAAVEEAKRELSHLHKELHRAQQEYKTVSEQLKGYKIKWNSEKRRQRELQKRQEQLDDTIARLRAENETAANVTIDTTELEEDVTQAEQQVSKLQREQKEIDRQIQELQPVVDGKRRELEEVAARNEKVLVDLEKAETDMTSFLNALSQRQEQLERKRTKVNQIREAVKQFEDSVLEKEQDRDKCLRTARILQYRRNERKRRLDGEKEAQEGNNKEEGCATPDVSDEPTEEELARIEIVQVEHDKDYYATRMTRTKAKVEKERKRQQLANTTPEIAYERFMRAKKDLEAKTKQITAIEENLVRLTDDVKARKRKWRMFRHHLERTTNDSFDAFLNLKGSAGSLEFDHKQGTLDLVVQKDGNEDSQTDDVKALSGGERSFTTLALLLALGERLETPFRVMDEFDVFLDPMARRIALQTLVEVAKDMEHRQFIFITPQDVSSLTPGPNLKITHMKAPKRNADVTATTQQTLD